MKRKPPDADVNTALEKTAQGPQQEELLLEKKLNENPVTVPAGRVMALQHPSGEGDGPSASMCHKDALSRREGTSMP